MISKIDSIELANEIIIERLKSDSPLFYDLDQYTHHALTGDHIEFMRDAINLDYVEFSRQYQEAFGNIESVDTYAFNGFSISKRDSVNYAVYPFSRTHLYKSIYPDLLPSLFHMYFNLMKNTERLYQIGTGAGKAFIISIESFTKQELKDLEIMQYKDTVQLMVTVSEQIAKQNTDIDYLLQKISEYEKNEKDLVQEIARLTEAIISTSITTWR